MLKKKHTFLSIPPDVWICLLLVTVTFAVYIQVKDFDFVLLDDNVYVTENPMVTNGLSLKSVNSAFSSTRGATWVPLTWISFMIDYELFGLDPGGYHLTNLMFHIANTVLLFLVVRTMTRAYWQSAFVAALFALHPLHVESVAWIAERKDVLSTFFWMATMWAYIRYAELPCLKRYTVMFLFFVPGLLAKPMLVTLPFVLLLIDFWPLGRFQFKVPFSAGCTVQKQNAARLLFEKFPLLICAALECAVIASVNAGSAGAVLPFEKLPITLRAANALVSYVSYIGKMFWPHNLAVLYPRLGQNMPQWQAVLAGALLVCITVLAIKMRRQRPYFLTGWLWYAGTLVPVSGLVQFGSHAMADRFTYVPLIGLFIIVAWGVADLSEKWKYRWSTLAFFGVIVFLVIAATTYRQIRYWRNSAGLFKHALKVTVNSDMVFINLGVAFFREGKIDEAISHFRKAMRLYPGSAAAHNNLGMALHEKGSLNEALDNYYEALRLEPDDADIHYNLGIAFFEQGRLDEAKGRFYDALRIEPDHAKAHNNLGAVFVRQGDLDEAIEHFREVLRLDPGHEVAKRNLNRVLEANRKQ